MGRRIDDPPLNGACNMARDEALLELRHAPTLRFYRWSRPTLSLGYFQAIEGLPLDELIARGGELIRRPTGGKAILHEDELTYSLCAPESGWLAGGPGLAMCRLHEVIGEVLRAQTGRAIEKRGSRTLESDRPGSAWCFLDSSSLDLQVDGRKLLGSAARRRAGWILFHGSLVLSAPRETPQVAALGSEPDLDRLSQELGRAMDTSFDAGVWSGQELELAERLAEERYASPAYLNRR